MQVLFNFQDILLQSVSNDFRRYLHEQINWNLTQAKNRKNK